MEKTKNKKKPMRASGRPPQRSHRSDKQSSQKREAPRNKPVKKDAVRAPGFQARHLAVTVIHDVMVKGRSLDGALNAAYATRLGQDLEPRDRALARLIAVTVLRRHGELAGVLNTFLGKPLSGDKSRIWPILLSGAAQLLILDVQPHAAISVSVDLAHDDPATERFAKLVNAILRRVSETGLEILKTSGAASRNFPDWLMASWRATYGEDVAEAMAEASVQEPALDISVAQDAPSWGETLGGFVLPTGSIRVKSSGRIEDLAGFADGAWWVQDAAAALPTKLFGDVQGQRIADLCAAPGGKTLQLAAGGAHVVAVDSSVNRLDRLKENLARTKLSATPIAADVQTWMPEDLFDGVLLDAPCTATGTIRRHPDILHVKRESDVGDLAKVQARLLQRAANFVRPGGTLIYCTCSLQPEEGEHQISAFLARHSAFRRWPLEPGEIGIQADWITPDGDLRTVPHAYTSDQSGCSGIDGFFAARLKRDDPADTAR